MHRSRTSPKRHLAGALVAGTIALMSLAGASAAGCSSAETTPAPDAALPPCNQGPFIFCNPAAADAPGCSTPDADEPLLSQLPEARYEPGCVIDYVGARDPQGDCRLEAVCKCVVGDGTPPPVVVDEDDDPDAGLDADGGADAAPDPTPPPQTGARWECYP